MLANFNEQIERVKEKVRKKEKLDNLLQEINKQYKQETEKAAQLKRQLEKEEKDVERLEKWSLTNLFLTLSGRKLEQLDKEQQELLAAKLKYDEAVLTLQDLEQERRELNDKLQHVYTARQEYEQLLKDKKKWILDQDTIWTEELYHLVEQEADMRADLKEYREAIRAGEGVLMVLDDAVEALGKAKGWATWDLVGGGMISTAIKHSHINDAQGYIHIAQQKLRQFEAELADIQSHHNMQLEVGSFLTFADYFFDGLIVDWMVRGKVVDSLEQARKTQYKVNDIVNDLRKRRDQLAREMDRVQEERIQLIESAG